MLQAWSTDQVVAGDRFPLIRDAINHAICPCDVRAEQPMGGFGARLEHVALGEVSVVRYSSSGVQRALRSPIHCRQDDRDASLLYVPLTAEFTVEQFGRSMHLQRGTAGLVRLNRPLVGYFQASSHVEQVGIQVRVPTSLLVQRDLRIDEVFNRPICLQRGSGRIMLSLIHEVIAEARHIQDSQAAVGLGHALVNTIASMGVEQRAGLAPPAHSSKDQRSLTRARVTECIRAHLGDPELSVDSIAERCGMSVRCVHRAFEGSGTTVSRDIREQRLLHCRKELRHPELGHRTVAEVAYRWGFKDVAHFSRAYKAQFGIAPSQDRQG